MYKLLVELLNDNSLDIYNWKQNRLNNFNNYLVLNHKTKSTFLSLAKFIVLLIYKTRINKKINLNKIIFVVNSFNQYKVGRLLYDNRASLTSVSYVDKDIHNIHLNLKDSLILSIFIILNIKRLVSVLNKKFIYLEFKIFFYFVIYYRHILNNYIKSVVIFNDHCVDSSIFKYIRKKHNFKLIYIQHAQPGKFFPKPDFDISLLDSENAMNIYKCSPSKRIKLIGHVNTKSLLKCRKVLSKKVLGLAINMSDDLINLSKNITHLCQVNNISTLKIKLHPAIKIPLDGFLKKSNIQINFVDNLIDFLTDIDILIAGESSILVEGIIAEKLCVLHNFTKDSFHGIYGFRDKDMFLTYYDFIKNYEIDLYLMNCLLKQKSFGKYFSASYGSEYEGNEISMYKRFIYH